MTSQQILTREGLKAWQSASQDDIMEVIDSFVDQAFDHLRFELKMRDQADGKWYVLFRNPGRTKGRGIGYLQLAKRTALSGGLDALISRVSPITKADAYQIILLPEQEARTSEVYDLRTPDRQQRAGNIDWSDAPATNEEAGRARKTST